MFGDINIENLKPRKPQIFLCKPDTTTISKLNEAYDINHSTRLGDLNEISMTVPYTVEVRKRHVRNPNIDVIRERYLIKVKLGKQEEYYVISEITDNSDDDKEVKEIKAFSLGYQLRDKMIRNYNEIGITARKAVEDALAQTVWTIGKNLSDSLNHFNVSASSGGAGGRTFDIQSATVLDFIIQIAESFNAVIVWDTINKTVDFELPEKVGAYKGMKVSYGKYLQSLGRESNTDEMVTRLTPYGAEGLTIHAFNPTGSGYIEDFSYFMYPFKRDVNKNVIQSSHYMSDGLCNAILDYKDKVEANRQVFSDYLDSLELRQTEKTQLENEYFNLLTEMYSIQDRITAKKSIEEYLHFGFYHDGTTDMTVETVSHNEDAFYMVVGYSDIDTTSTLTIDGQAVTIPARGEWKVINRRMLGFSETRFAVEGTSPADLTFILVSVTEGEYYDSTDADLLQKYCEPIMDSKMMSKQGEIDSKQAQIELVIENINLLQAELSIESNFTHNQIVERNQFIIEKEYTNDNLMSAEELYKHSEKEFEKLREPQMVLNIDIINFLEVVDAHRDWDRLNLGDTIKIEHERLGVEVLAKIIGIDYDYEGQNISLTIANVKDIKSDEDKLIDALYGAISTSTTVEMSKFKWDKVGKQEEQINSILNEPWDATARAIKAGTNESVEIGRQGISIKNPDDPDKMLVANHAVLAITKSGGRVWEHAITTDGIIGERIIGKILIGESLLLENSSGSVKFDKNGLTVTDAGLSIVAGDGTPYTLQEKFTEQKSYTDQLRSDIGDELTDVKGSISDLDTEINTTFKDGIIDEAEKLSIKEHLKQLASEKSDVDNRYTTVYGNPFLIDKIATTDTVAVTDKADLKTAKDDFDLKYNQLVSAINTAISDSAIIDDERSNVESKFTAYQTSVGNLGNAFEVALDNISKNQMSEAEASAKGYADALKSALDKDIGDVGQNVTDLNDYVDTTFKDGVISEAEKLAIAEHIDRLNAEKKDLDERYGIVYTSTYLKDDSIAYKTNLLNAKTDYDSKHVDLLTAIHNAIKDSAIIDDERTIVNTAFTNYNTSLGSLSSSLESAVDCITKYKSTEALDSSKEYTDGVKKLIDEDIKGVNTNLTGLNTYVDGTFRDGVVDDAEKKAIAQHIDSLTTEKSDVDDRYTTIYANADLIDVATEGTTPAITDKADLKTAKDAYDVAHTNLISAINTAIADSSIIADEKSNVDSKFTAYRSTLAKLSTAFENAIENIAENKKRYAVSHADSLKKLIDSDIGDVDTKVGDLNDYVDTTFKDGVIEESEAKAIGKYINSLNVEKTDIDNRYINIYGNAYLRTATVKSALETAKANYDTSHTALINSVNTAISDGKTTSTESADVDSKFSDYNVKLGSLSTAFENAIDDIAKNKTNESIQHDKAFEHGLDFWSDSYNGEDVDATANGNIVGGSGSIGGNVMEIVGTRWMYSRYAIPIDTGRTYKMKFRVRQTVDPTTGGASVYAGVATLDKNYQNLTGGSGTHRYFAISSRTITTADGWLEFEGTITGVGDSHSNFRSGTAYVRPMFIVNYSGGNGTAQVDLISFDDVTETLDGKSAWGKFSGAGNSLPSGNVAFGNGLTADKIEASTLNFNGRNDRNSTTPRNPVVGVNVAGTVVDELDHTLNTDGSVNISFEWDFDDSGSAGDIDGFIVYVMQASSSSVYSFGTSASTENVTYVSPEKRAYILYGVPANKYYTFGVQAYRIVDKDVDATGVKKSSIVKSTKTGHNPYQPSTTVAFEGDVTGTIDGTSATTVKDQANNSLQSGTAYNSVKVDATSGLVATRSDDKARTVINATDGISVQKYEGSAWNKKFYVDTNGDLHIEGNITMNGGSINWTNIGKPSYTASDVGARPDSWTPTASDVGAKPNSYSAFDEIGSNRLTKIDQNGVYTGTLVASQIYVTKDSNFGEGYDPSTKETPSGALAKANDALVGATNAGFFTTNTIFQRWTNNLPNTYSLWSSTPSSRIEKNESDTTVGEASVKMTATGTEDIGLYSNFSYSEQSEYVVVEMKVMVHSGSDLRGAGLLVDWQGSTTYKRQVVALKDEIGTPVYNTWYTIKKTLKKPAGDIGTWGNFRFYLMANWSGSEVGGVKVAKTISYDMVGIRPASKEEISIFEGRDKWDARTTKITDSGLYTGTIEFNQAKGGTMTLGGSSNGNGLLDLKDKDNNTVVKLTNEGVVLSNGGKLIGGNGVISTLQFQNSGDRDGWDDVGEMAEGYSSRGEAFVFVDIPPNFTILSAKLTVYAMPIKVYEETWNADYTSSTLTYKYTEQVNYMKFKKSSNISNYRIKAILGSEYYLDTTGSSTDLTSAIGWGSGWTPPENDYTQMKEGAIPVSNFSTGMNAFFLASGSTATTQNCSFVKAIITVTGYTN